MEYQDKQLRGLPDWPTMSFSGNAYLIEGLNTVNVTARDYTEIAATYLFNVTLDSSLLRSFM